MTVGPGTPSGPSGPNTPSLGERREIAGERLDIEGERREIAGERLDIAGERLDIAGERLDIAGRYYVEAKRIQERHKTIRAAIIGMVVLLGLAICGYVFLRLADRPPWLQALAILAGAIVPSIVVWRIRVQFRRYMELDHSKRIELEASIDASRTTSGISPDGTTPDDT